MRDDYSDIINLPHHVSAAHPQMKRADRAAQFSPFAALVGHGAAIAETARLTDAAPDLSEDVRAALDAKLGLLLATGADPVTVTWFVPDARKAGGSYSTLTGSVKRLDEASHALVFSDGTRVPLSSVVSVSAG